MQRPGGTSEESLNTPCKIGTIIINETDSYCKSEKSIIKL